MSAISVKKLMSSLGVVSTDLDGGSQLWPVKGTLVSTVIVVVSSVEKGRRWRNEEEEAVERGLRRLELRRARAMVVGGGGGWWLLGLVKGWRRRAEGIK
ncbi:hypothetical protein Hanom_Chr17g01548251 [Helianthus anomalus]